MRSLPGGMPGRRAGGTIYQRAEGGINTFGASAYLGNVLWGTLTRVEGLLSWGLEHPTVRYREPCSTMIIIQWTLAVAGTPRWVSFSQQSAIGFTSLFFAQQLEERSL